MKRLVFALKKSMYALVVATLFVLIGLFNSQKVEAASVWLMNSSGTTYGGSQSSIASAFANLSYYPSATKVYVDGYVTECSVFDYSLSRNVTLYVDGSINCGGYTALEIYNNSGYKITIAGNSSAANSINGGDNGVGIWLTKGSFEIKNISIAGGYRAFTMEGSSTATLSNVTMGGGNVYLNGSSFSCSYCTINTYVNLVKGSGRILGNSSINTSKANTNSVNIASGTTFEMSGTSSVTNTVYTAIGGSGSLILDSSNVSITGVNFAISDSVQVQITLYGYELSLSTTGSTVVATVVMVSTPAGSISVYSENGTLLSSSYTTIQGAINALVSNERRKIVVAGNMYAECLVVPAGVKGEIEFGGSDVVCNDTAMPSYAGESVFVNKGDIQIYNVYFIGGCNSVRNYDSSSVLYAYNMNISGTLDGAALAVTGTMTLEQVTIETSYVIMEGAQTEFNVLSGIISTVGSAIRADEGTLTIGKIGGASDSVTICSSGTYAIKGYMSSSGDIDFVFNSGTIKSPSSLYLPYNVTGGVYVPNGYEEQVTVSGTYRISTVSRSGVVALISGSSTSYYGSIAQAVADLDTAEYYEIQLLGDISEDVTIGEDGKVVGYINLNGYTWTGTLSLIGSIATDIILVDYSSSGSGKLTSSTADAVVTVDDGHFTVGFGGSVYNSGSEGIAVYVGSGASLVVDIQAIGVGRNETNGTNLYAIINDGNVSLLGGLVYAKSLAIENHASLAVNYATVSGKIVNYGEQLSIGSNATISVLDNEGICEMSGGMIQNGVYNYGEFYFYDGVIGNDGNIEANVYNEGYFELSGGEIREGGYAEYLVYNDGTFTMKSGTLGVEGTGWAIYNYSVVNIEDGTVYSTTLESAIYNYAGTLTVTGGRVTGNFIAIEGAGTVTIGSSSLSYSDTSPIVSAGAGDGVGVYMTSGTLNFYNGVIRGGTMAYNIDPTGKRTDAQLMIDIISGHNVAYYAAFANVASITYSGSTTYYTSIQDAINALSSSVSKTIDILMDGHTECVVIENKKGTINLNGFDWYCESQSEEYIVELKGNSDVVINGDGGLLQSYYYGAGISGGSVLAMNDLSLVVYESSVDNESAIDVSDNSELYLEDVSVTDVDGMDAIWIYNSYVQIEGGHIVSSSLNVSGTTSEVEVNETAFTSARITVSAGSTLTLTDVAFTGIINSSAAITNKGNLYISGGGFGISSSKDHELIKNEGMIEITGAPEIETQNTVLRNVTGTASINITTTLISNEKEVIIIDEGSVTLYNGNLESLDLEETEYTSTVMIWDDGLFTIAEGANSVVTSHGYYAVNGQATFNFYGGILYSTDTSLGDANYTIADLLDGYILKSEIVSGKLKTYVVYDPDAFVASVTCNGVTKKYLTITEAINGNSCSGKTVTLLKDAGDVSVTFTQYNMTIDLAGKNWTTSGDYPIIVNNANANITIKDSNQFSARDYRSKLIGRAGAISFNGNILNVQYLYLEGGDVDLGTLYVKGGTVNVSYTYINGSRQHAIYVEGGTTTLTNLTAEVQDEGAPVALVEGGTLTLVSGILYDSGYGYGVKLTGGTLNIGNNSTSTNDSALIVGQDYAVYNVGGTVNFNKGTLYGKSTNITAYYGDINVTSIANTTGYCYHKESDTTTYRINTPSTTAKVSATAYFDFNSDGSSETVTIKFPSMAQAKYVLTESFAYTSKPTLKLLSNITECVTISGADGYIHLNSKTWNCTTSSTTTLSVSNTKFLRIYNGTISGGYRGIYAYNNGDLQLENVDVTGSFSDAAIYVTATTTVVKHYSGDVTASGSGRAVYIDSGTYYYYNGTIQNTASSSYSVIYLNSTNSNLYLTPAVSLTLDGDNDIFETAGTVSVYSYSSKAGIESSGVVTVGRSENNLVAGPNDVYSNNVIVVSKNNYAVINKSDGTFNFYGGELHGKSSNTNAYSGIYRTDSGLAISHTTQTSNGSTYRIGTLVDAVWKVEDSNLSTNDPWNFFENFDEAVSDSRVEYDGTIYLLMNKTGSITISEGVEVTIDLNGYTLQHSLTVVTVDHHNADVTIVNGTISSSNSSYYAIYVDGGNVTVQCTITAAGTAVHVGTTGALYIDDVSASITSTSSSATYYSVYNQGGLIIESGVVTKTVYNDTTGGFTMTGGTILTNNEVALTNKGNADIGYSDSIYRYTIRSNNSYAIKNTGSLNVIGRGGIIADNANAIHSTAGAVTISGGYVYSGTTGDIAAVYIGGGTLTVNDGALIVGKGYSIKTLNIGFTFNGGNLYGSASLSNKLTYNIGTGSVTLPSGRNVSATKTSISLGSIFNDSNLTTSINVLCNTLTRANVSLNDQVYFDSITSAINGSANLGISSISIKLLNGRSESVSISSAITATIDLNGNSWSGSDNNTAPLTMSAGNITVTNNAAVRSQMIKGGTNAINISNGTLTINNIDIDGTIDIKGGSVTFDYGEISGQVKIASGATFIMGSAANALDENAIVKYSSDYAVINLGTFNFYGGLLYGKSSNSVAFSGTANLPNGEELFSSTATYGGSTYVKTTLVYGKIYVVEDARYYVSIADAKLALNGTNNKTIRLLANINECVSISTSVKMTLDLNGYTLTCNSTNVNNYTIGVNAAGTIIITDTSTAKTGAIVRSGTTATNAYAIYSSTATTTINYAKITGNIFVSTSTLNVGTIDTTKDTDIQIEGVIVNGGTVNFNGGTITYNGNALTTAAASYKLYINGGVINSSVNNIGIMEINGGTISGTVVNGGTATMTGGTINDAVTNNGGTFAITGGTINSSITNTGTFGINRGTVTVTGNIINNSGSVELHSGSITGNITNKADLLIAGAAITGAVTSTSTTELGLQINGGTINGSVTITSGVFTMMGGTISTDTNGHAGAVVAIEGATSVNISGGRISSSAYLGLGIDVDADVNLSNVSITGTVGVSGTLYNSHSLILNSGTIVGNNGYGISLNGKFTYNGGTIAAINKSGVSYSYSVSSIAHAGSDYTEIVDDYCEQDDYYVTNLVKSVAKIGTTSYNSLSAAISAASNNQTITLQKSFTILPITINKSITIDFNGQFINNYIKNVSVGTGSYNVFDIEANVKFNDSSYTEKLLFETYSTSASIAYVSSGKLEIKDVTMTGYNGISVATGALLEITTAADVARKTPVITATSDSAVKIAANGHFNFFGGKLVTGNSYAGAFVADYTDITIPSNTHIFKNATVAYLIKNGVGTDEYVPIPDDDFVVDAKVVGNEVHFTVNTGALNSSTAAVKLIVDDSLTNSCEIGDAATEAHCVVELSKMFDSSKYLYNATYMHVVGLVYTNSTTIQVIRNMKANLIVPKIKDVTSIYNKADGTNDNSKYHLMSNGEVILINMFNNVAVNGVTQLYKDLFGDQVATIVTNFNSITSKSIYAGTNATCDDIACIIDRAALSPAMNYASGVPTPVNVSIPILVYDYTPKAWTDTAATSLSNEVNCEYGSVCEVTSLQFNDYAGNQVTDVETVITLNNRVVKSIDTSVVGTYIVTTVARDIRGYTSAAVVREYNVLEDTRPVATTPVADVVVVPTTISYTPVIEAPTTNNIPVETVQVETVINTATTNSQKTEVVQKTSVNYDYSVVNIKPITIKKYFKVVKSIACVVLGVAMLAKATPITRKRRLNL